MMPTTSRTGYFCLFLCRLIAWVTGESVTLIPPQNLLHMLMFDRVQANGIQQLPLIRFPKHAGVLSGIPIPTLWPVLPSFPSTRTPKSSASLGLNKQLNQQVAPQNTAVLGSASSGYGGTSAASSQQPSNNGGSFLLSQPVQPSQPILPSSPFIGSQVPALYPQPTNNVLQMPEAYPTYNLPQNLNYVQNNPSDLNAQIQQQQQQVQQAQQAQQQQQQAQQVQQQLQQQQQQLPIGQTFGNLPNGQTNPLTTQDILLSTYSNQQQQPQQVVNAFGSFMPDQQQQQVPGLTQQQPQLSGLSQQQQPQLSGLSQQQQVLQGQGGQFNNPSQVYGYGGAQQQSAMAGQLQQSVGPLQAFNQGQNSLMNVVPGSAYANSLEEQYPGCHK